MNGHKKPDIMKEKKKDYIADALNEISDKYIEEAAKLDMVEGVKNDSAVDISKTGREKNIRGSRRWIKIMGAAAACVIIIAGARIVLKQNPDNSSAALDESPQEIHDQTGIPEVSTLTDDDHLEDSMSETEASGYSKGIEYKVIETIDGDTPVQEAADEVPLWQAEDVSAENKTDTVSLNAWMSAGEIFALGRDIFRGTVEKKEVYQVVKGVDTYFTVLTVKVEEGYRGEIIKEDTCRIYLPVAAGYISDSAAGDLERLEVGSSAIFMPEKASADTGIEGADAYLCYEDFAEYYFSEGIRFLFLQTEYGVSYDESVYDIQKDGDVTLDDVAEYIQSQISPEQ